MKPQYEAGQTKKGYKLELKKAALKSRRKDRKQIIEDKREFLNS